jgi:hypothetical protein
MHRIKRLKKGLRKFKRLLDEREFEFPNTRRSKMFREDDSNLIASKLDSEMMRVFPPNTDPNHILILYELFTRREHLK